MALINCRNCGKKISESIDKCIHCGFFLRHSPTIEFTETQSAEYTELSQVETPDESKTIADRSNGIEPLEESLVNYSKLDERKKAKLETEFLKVDKDARNFRRKGLEIKKFIGYIFWMLPVTRAVAVLLEYVKDTYFGGVIYDGKMYSFTLYCIFGLIFLWAFAIIIVIVRLYTYKKSIRKYVYYKKY